MPMQLTGLEFKLSAQDVHEQVNDGVRRRQDIGEKDEADDDGELVVEAKGLVERTVVDEDGEEGEDVEEVELQPISLLFSHRFVEKTYL